MYIFDVSYPKEDGKLEQIQENILRRFPQCKHKSVYTRKVNGSKSYYSTVYQTDDPEEIVRVASALRQTPQIFIALVSVNGTDIYYHPMELSTLDPQVKQQYISVMKRLPQTERTVHDYLVNLYHDVPTRKVF